MTAMPTRTLIELLQVRAETLADRGAFHFLSAGEHVDAQLTYAQLDRRARAVAARLRERARAGEAVVLAYPAGHEFICAFFGCLYAGVVAVPVGSVHPRKDNERLAAIVADCGARLVLTTSAGANAFASAAQRQPLLAQSEALQTDDCVGDHELPAAARAAADSIAFLQYTSGSTHTPRGVRISHSNILANLSAIYAAEGNGAHSRGLSWLPAYHDMGLIEGILQPLYGGYPAWLMPHSAFVQRPARWLHAISRFGITVSGGPNFAYDLCVRRIEENELARLNLRSWEVAYCGAEPVRANTLQAFARRFGVCGFERKALRPVYGLAEATLLVAAPARGTREPKILLACGERLDQGQFVRAHDTCTDKVPLVSCGEPIAGTALAIVDPEERRALPPGAIGEIWVSGPGVACGYRGEPPALGSAFVRCDLGGVRGRWLRTGDLGFIAEGELFVSGRIKDLIIVRGRKLHPQDIEQTVERCHAHIVPNSAAVFSSAGTETEDIVVCVEMSRAFAGLEPQNDLGQLAMLADTIRECVCRGHAIAVATVAFVPAGALARTSSGKLMRYRCRSDFNSGKIAVLQRFDPVAMPPRPHARSN